MSAKPPHADRSGDHEPRPPTADSVAGPTEPAPRNEAQAEHPEHAPDPSVAPRPAGFARRLVATLIDMVVFSALSVAVLWPALDAVDWSLATTGVEVLAREVSRPQRVEHIAAGVGMWIALWWGYFAVGWGLWGATPGKWLLGLRVYDHAGRCPIGFTRSMLRLVAYTVSSLTLGAGHLLVLIRPDRRALHDILAGTRVCRRPRR